MVLLLVGFGAYLGCDHSPIDLPLQNVNHESSGQLDPLAEFVIPQRTPSNIIVGSFNLQRLGPTKISDPWVVEKFAEIIRVFDVLALQEITSVDQRTLALLVEQVNRNGANYAYTISERIGREATNGYREQYAFVYDQNRLEGGPQYCYKVEDPQDLLHREPFVGRFRSRVVSGAPFSFSLINIHTDPDEIDTELDVLADVFVNVRQFEYAQGEDDVVLLGDLNAGPNQLRKLGSIPGILPLVISQPTNTRGTRTIDNFLLDPQLTSEYVGRCGTIDLAKVFNLGPTDAERLSDHLPIWAEFSSAELRTYQAAVAGIPTDSVRR